MNIEKWNTGKVYSDTNYSDIILNRIIPCNLKVICFIPVSHIRFTIDGK